LKDNGETEMLYHKINSFMYDVCNEISVT